MFVSLCDRYLGPILTYESGIVSRHPIYRVVTVPVFLGRREFISGGAAFSALYLAISILGMRPEGWKLVSPCKLGPSSPPARTFRDAPWSPVMTVIPPGTFSMGSATVDGEASEDEFPKHQVTISQPFALGVYPMTFAEWVQFANNTEADYRPEHLAWDRGNHPITDVSWNDAQAYVEWLSNTLGTRYRLPSEAEWEHACRAGADTPYWWGDELGHNLANCCAGGSLWNGDQTSPVGHFQPNPLGLHDVHGNVDEWVEDAWHDNYANAPTDGSAWVTELEESHRVIRGGA